MTKPYVPFYKPLGMSDETYRQEVHKAEHRLAEWEEMKYDQLREALEDGKRVEIVAKNKYGDTICWTPVFKINEAVPPDHYRVVT